jgi:hypothetical protein
MEMVKRTDADRDGKIGYADFAKLLKVTTRFMRASRRTGAAGGLDRQGNVTPTKSDPGSSPFRKRGGQYSVASHTRSNSSIDVETAALQASLHKSVERRRSSAPLHLVPEALAAMRLGSMHQEQAATEIASVSKEDALKKIHNLSLDVHHNKRTKEASHDPADHGGDTIPTSTGSIELDMSTSSIQSTQQEAH